MFNIISIHTPAKGVTTADIKRKRILSISIHTPAKGVTRGGDNMQWFIIDFNPHSREGSDLRFYPQVLKLLVFQSTLPRREWLRSCTGFPAYISFQSTLPRREWQVFPCCFVYLYNFNPHSREGSDKQGDGWTSSPQISIHTPAKGVTPFTFVDYENWQISIHTPAKGVTDVQRQW